MRSLTLTNISLPRVDVLKESYLQIRDCPMSFLEVGWLDSSKTVDNPLIRDVWTREEFFEQCRKHIHAENDRGRLAGLQPPRTPVR